MYNVDCHTVDFWVKYRNIAHQADIPKIEIIRLADKVLESVNVLLQGHPARNQQILQ
jgi:hypothetical protein